MSPIQGDPILASKFRVPQAPSQLVQRARLIERLQQAVDHSLTLIAAPAGFGKTTLISTWLEQAPLQAAWLSLEPGDDDLIRFWSYVFTALGRVLPGSEKSALPLLQASPLVPPPAIESILSVWINDLAGVTHQVALVLDDYHVITAPSIQRALTYLINHLPPLLHLIIATRADPPLPLARLRASGQLTEIRAADLRFTPEEAAAFLSQALRMKLSTEEIAAMEARTEGWIAGLRLAALAMLALQGHTDIHGFLEAFVGSHRYIIDYLVEEVLERQPEPVQAFLLRTAILDRMQGSLCEAVTSEPGGQAMLEQLEQSNLFVTPLDDERLWYRYHQLFAKALRHQLQRRQPAQAQVLHRRASAWYAQHGLLREAVHHALAAADYEQAVGLMEQAGNSLVRQGEIATLQRWVDALPNEVIRSHIEIAIWQGWLLFVGGKPEAAERHLEDLERNFEVNRLTEQAPEQHSAILGRIAAIRASIAISQRDLPRTIALSRLALEDLPKDALTRSYVAGYLGKAHYFNGDIAAASQALEEACRISWEVNHIYGFFLVVYDLAQLQILQGRLYQADQTCRQALQRIKEQGEDPPACGLALVIRGQLEREWNHLDAATSLLQEGIWLCEQTANISAVVQAYTNLAFIHQARGDPDGANGMIRKAKQRAEMQHLLQARSILEVEAAQAWLSLLQGNESGTLRWAEGCGLSPDQKLNPLREREVLTLIRILIARHRLDEAGKWLENLLQLAEAQGRGGSVIEILLLQAEARGAAGELKQAMQRLAQALSLAEPQGYLRLFMDEGTPTARLLLQMRTRSGNSQSGTTAYRERLLALMGTAHLASNAADMIPVGEALSERELEVLRLIIAGYSNREIAEELVIAVSTVKWYVNAIYAKLQVASRTKAIARARELSIA